MSRRELLRRVQAGEGLGDLPQIVESLGVSETATSLKDIGDLVPKTRKGTERAGLTRRQMLETTIGAAVGIGAGLYLIRRRRLSELRWLEDYALKTQEKTELQKHASPFMDGKLRTYTDKSATLAQYEMWYKMSFGPRFTYQKAISKLRELNFPNEKTLLVADIGGGAGTAAVGLNNMPGVEAFVIDPWPAVAPEEWGLPRNRLIIREIEDTGLPDNVFHFMTSHNTLQYTDVEKAFTETYRLLKPGGLAILEHEFWYPPDEFQQLENLPIKDKVTVIYGGQPRINDVKYLPLPEFIKTVKAIREQQGEKAERGLQFLFPAFCIDKIP